jgi:ubiquinone/menaquinone biosynthesis C-methylase UbiE
MSLPPYALNQASFPEMYEHCLVGPLFLPWARVLIERTALARGERILDIACGTGIVARTAKASVGTEGRVVGIDVSAPMLAMARSVAPAIDWREGNAGDLPLGAGEQFDVVFCQQGLQFFPDKPAAVRQFRRAVAPGGRLGVATWRPDAEIPIFAELRAIAERHLGPVVDLRHCFGETEPLERLLAESGFSDVRVETLSDTPRFDDGPVFARLNTMALVGMSAAGKSMSDDERARVVSAIVADSRAVLPRYAHGSGIAFKIRTNVATAKG